jgi:hypothetical protein
MPSVRSIRAAIVAAAALAASTAGATDPPREPAREGGGAAKAAPAGPTRTIGLDEIRPGMTGYGLTVFRGTRPERFDVKVISVLRHFLPKQDLILVESDDARLKHMGIVAGMSGSPVYLHTDGGDRLAGALAYGWHFAKDPIAGVTPIANMLAEVQRPLRGRGATPVAEARNDALPPRLPVEATAALADPTAPRLVPATVPLSLAGFSPSVARELGEQLAPYGVVPLAAGGGGVDEAEAAREGPARFEPGSAISVELIRGDMSAAGTGTVTWVEGDKVIAFGHPMFNLGEIYLPVSTAVVHAVLPAVSSSFKIASPRREVGTLVQDRQSCIVADTGQRSDMIPVRVRVSSPGHPGESVFNAEVIRHRFLTPLLASTVVANAAQNAVSDVADATFTVRTSLGVRGEQRPLELVDHAFSTDGFSQRSLGGLTGVKAIGDLLFNPFSPASLERIDVQVDLEYKADVAEITGVQLASDTLDPGSRSSLRVTLRPYGGAEYVESVPLSIPPSLAGALVKVEVAAGNLVKPDQAPPETLHNFVENLRKGYPARSIVVTLQTPDDALALRGAVVSDLPSSVLDTLRPGASTRRGETFKISSRTVVPMRSVVLGKQEIQVKVREAASN